MPTNIDDKKSISLYLKNSTEDRKIYTIIVPWNISYILPHLITHLGIITFSPYEIFLITFLI